LGRVLIASGEPLAVDFRQTEGLDRTPAIRREADIVKRHRLFSVIGKEALDDQWNDHGGMTRAELFQLRSIRASENGCGAL
jgi:hypothetical protein